MRSLYTINEELDLIVSSLESEDYDQESTQTAIDEWLFANRDEIVKKIDDYCAVIQERTQVAKMRKDEAKQLSAMAATDERIAELLKDRAKLFFARVGIDKLETLHFKPRVQANGGVLPVALVDAVRDDPFHHLPEEFVNVVYTPNVPAIREALEVGKSVPGATLEDRGTHFRLR